MRGQRKFLTLVIALMLVLTLVAGCAAPAAAPAPVAPAPASSADANLLPWNAWKAKMTGTINKDYYVVDLRTPDEITLEKSLEGSINIDANATLAKGNVAIIEEKLANIPKNAVILVHCKSGRRVKANLAKFLEKGYVNAFGLMGGLR